MGKLGIAFFVCIVVVSNLKKTQARSSGIRAAISIRIEQGSDKLGDL